MAVKWSLIGHLTQLQNQHHHKPLFNLCQSHSQTLQQCLQPIPQCHHHLLIQSPCNHSLTPQHYILCQWACIHPLWFSIHQALSCIILRWCQCTIHILRTHNSIPSCCVLYNNEFNVTYSNSQICSVAISESRFDCQLAITPKSLALSDPITIKSLSLSFAFTILPAL